MVKGSVQPHYKKNLDSHFPISRHIVFAFRFLPPLLYNATAYTVNNTKIQQQLVFEPTMLCLLWIIHHPHCDNL